jgi:uncharacterized protein (TIGR02246 family)
VDDAARRWVDAWTRGWREHDPDPIARVYSEDAVFLSHPFRDPLHGRDGAREYAQRAFADEESAEFRFSEPIVAGDRAACEYWATLMVDGRQHTLAGTTVLHFDADGLVDRHLDYWAMEDGVREPPPRWGA